MADGTPRGKHAKKNNGTGDGLIHTLTDLVRYELGKDSEPIPEPPDDYVFHFPRAYAIQTWHQYRNHGILPERGGWNDQPHALVTDDWGYLNWCYGYVRQELQGNREPDADSGDLQQLIQSLGGGSEMMTWSQIREQS